MTKKHDFENDEYQFPQDGHDDPMLIEPSEHEELQEKPFILEEEAAPTGLAAIWMQHKRIIVIIGVLTVVATTFSIIRALHKPAEVAPTAPALVAPAPVVQPVIDPQVVEQLTELRQESINNSVTIRQLQAQLSQMTNTANQTRAAEQQLNQSVAALAEQMQQLAAQVKVLAHPKVKHVAAAPKVIAPAITFQLRAVVPGRAWIVGSDGQSHSVAVGDPVPPYGTVQSIDADAGVVITTSGKTIKF